MNQVGFFQSFVLENKKLLLFHINLTYRLLWQIIVMISQE